MDKYELGVNHIKEDIDYCDYCEKQYTVITEAESIYEAQEKAIAFVKKQFDLEYETVCIGYIRRAKESDDCNC